MHGWYSTIVIGYTWYCMVQGALSHGAMAAWCQLLPPLSRWLSPLKVDKLLWPHMCICAPCTLGTWAIMCTTTKFIMYMCHHVHHVQLCTPSPCSSCTCAQPPVHHHAHHVHVHHHQCTTMIIMYMCTTRVPPSPLILLRSCLIRQMRSGHSFYGECELIANMMSLKWSLFCF